MSCLQLLKSVVFLIPKNEPAYYISDKYQNLTCVLWKLYAWAVHAQQLQKNRVTPETQLWGVVYTRW